MTTAGVDRSSNVVDDLCLAAQTVATAESLTGGLVVASLIDVPGASAVVRGGMVVYHPDLKVSLAGVDDMLLAVGGSVQSEVAAQLARGARTRFVRPGGWAPPGSPVLESRTVTLRGRSSSLWTGQEEPPFAGWS